MDFEVSLPASTTFFFRLNRYFLQTFICEDVTWSFLYIYLYFKVIPSLNCPCKIFKFIPYTCRKLTPLHCRVTSHTYTKVFKHCLTRKFTQPENFDSNENSREPFFLKNIFEGMKLTSWYFFTSVIEIQAFYTLKIFLSSVQNSPNLKLYLKKKEALKKSILSY